jgi:hypothetical protein
VRSFKDLLACVRIPHDNFMIRLYYLPREFSSIFFEAVYLPPQNNAGTKTTLKKLYRARSKQENIHKESALLVAVILMQQN